MTKLCKTPGTTPEGHGRIGLSTTAGKGVGSDHLDGDSDGYREHQTNTGTTGTSDVLTGHDAGGVDEALTPRLLGGTVTTAVVQLSSRNEDGASAEDHEGMLMRGEGIAERVHAVAPETAAETVDASASASAIAVAGVSKPTTALTQGTHNTSALKATTSSSSVTGSSIGVGVDVGTSGGGRRKKTGWSRGGRRRRRGNSGSSSTAGGGTQQQGRSQKGGLEGSKIPEASAGRVGNDEAETRMEGEMSEEEIGVFGGSDVVANGQAENVSEEDDEGNVEYKLKLVNPPLDRLEHLFTQMNWRLNEGRGECVYMVGYEDDGKATGISPSDLSASIKTLKVMMKAVGAKISKMEVQAGAGGGKLRVARVAVVRQAAVLDGLPAGSASRGLRIGVLGHAGAGKSTLVGVLTRGLSDNGRGLARMQVFRHNHEVFNGQTSSISQQALTLPLARRGSAARNGRRSAGGGGGSSSPNHKRKQGVESGGKGEDSRYAEAIRLSSSLPRSTRLGGASASNGFASEWARGRRRGESLDESGRRALRWAGSGSASATDEEESRVLTFIDQPGHEKYLKTTLTGMTGSALDYAMLVVSGVAGVQHMTREHLAIALALQLPLFLVMTKTDVAGTMPTGMSPTRTPPPQPAAAALLPSTAIELALQGLDRVLWSCMGKRAKIVEGVEDAEAAADAIRGESGAAGTSWDGLVPVIQVSSVTADGFTELRAFLGRLAPPEPLEAMYKEARGKAAEVRISDVFVVEGVGEVYAGTVVSGTVSVGDRLLLGPTGPRGSFVRTAVASVHVSRLAVRSASAGQTASFTLVADPDGDGDGDDSETDSAPAPPTLTPTALPKPTPTFTPPDFGESQDDDDVAIPRSAGNNARNGPRNGSGGFGGGWSCGGAVVGGRLEDGGDDGHGKRVESSPLDLGEASLASGSMDHGSDAGKATAGRDNDGGVSVERPSPLLVEGGAAVGEGESPGRRLRKGMVLVEATSRPNTTCEFEAEVMILHHPRVIRENYQPVVHAHNICQSARIISMVRSSPARSATSDEGEGSGSTGIKSGERAICRFRFLYRPEYLSAGTTIVLREGRTRGFGKVISVN